MAEIGCVVAIVHSAPVPVREESGNAVVLVTLKLYYQSRGMHMLQEVVEQEDVVAVVFMIDQLQQKQQKKKKGVNDVAVCDKQGETVAVAVEQMKMVKTIVEAHEERNM